MGELNLIPYQLKEKRSAKDIQIKYMTAAMIGAILMSVAIIVPKIWLVSVEKENTLLQQQVAVGDKVLEESKKIKTQLDTMNQYIAKVDSLSKKRILVSQKVKGIGKHMPFDVTFQSLNYGNGTISIVGEALNYNSITEFAANMQMSKEYKNTYINSINFNQSTGKYIFSVTIEQM